MLVLSNLKVVAKYHLVEEVESTNKLYPKEEIACG